MSSGVHTVQNRRADIQSSPRQSSVVPETTHARCRVPTYLTGEFSALGARTVYSRASSPQTFDGCRLFLELAA